MATILGAPVPLGYDLFPSEDGDLSSSLPSLEEMMVMESAMSNPGFPYDEEMLDARYVSLEDPPMNHLTSSSTLELSASAGGGASAPDAARSPGGSSKSRTSLHLHSGQSTSRQAPSGGIDSSAGGSSLSPAERYILTPTSTNLEYGNASISGDDDIDEPSSGISPTSTDGDFVYVHRFSNPLVGATAAARMNNRPPPSSGGSGASRASSIAPPASSNATSFAGQWGPLPTVTTDGWMAHDGTGNFAHAGSFGSITASYAFDNDAFAIGAQIDDDDLLSDLSTFEDTRNTAVNANLPFRVMGGHNAGQNYYRLGSPFAQQFLQAQQRQHYHHGNVFHPRPQPATYPPAHQHMMQTVTGGNFTIPSNAATTLSASFQQQANVYTLPSNMKQEHTVPSQRQNDTSQRSFARQPTPHRQSQRPLPASAVKQEPRQTPSNAAAASSSNRPLHAIAKRDPAVVSNEARRPTQPDTGRTGGRQKHSHLGEQARQKSHKMRKVTACWRCALQRDPCDEGTPCQRCMMKIQKGQTYFFDCDRSKLPEFVQDFLPLQASMTLMHQKQSIEDCVNDQVLEWDQQSPIDVYLTSGYGPALRWKLYEFRPRTAELLGQFQYLQNPTTGRTQRYQKYSPPFGLLKLDSSDDTHFEEYLDQLLLPEYLWDLGWTCFEEECQVDATCFQARMLDLMCKLYQDTHDYDLEELLRAIIRMMIITYIMGHTLTILEETLPSVLTSVKLSTRPTQAIRHTSPRLANRQLKFFFAILRNNIYEKILKWQQQTLHTSGKKEATWLPSFCAMLGFGMVLEEVQRTIQIQADAKSAKGELSHEQANTEAYNACERIDDRYKLLVGLFQCKYRDKKWGENGSFGNGTPDIRDQAAREFLRSLRNLLEENSAHLESRKDVECTPENQCLYTSRLVARFLLPFLGLPPS